MTDIRRQVAEGRLVIRQMTAEERERYPPPSARPKTSRPQTSRPPGRQSFGLWSRPATLEPGRPRPMQRPRRPERKQRLGGPPPCARADQARRATSPATPGLKRRRPSSPHPIEDLARIDRHDHRPAGTSLSSPVKETTPSNSCWSGVEGSPISESPRSKRRPQILRVVVSLGLLVR